MPSMSDALLQYELHKFLSWRGHILEALSKRNYGKAHCFKILNHLDRAPAIECYLANVKFFTKSLDELLDVAVMNDISFCGLETSLLLPHLVRNMIPSDAKIQGILLHPEIREHNVFIFFIKWREHQNKGRDIGCTR